MPNELILVLSLIVCYGLVVVWYLLFGKSGLFAFTAIVMVLANIEVNILIVAFGLEQTLGNIMFACSFLMTDILSELYGKKSANKAVNIGIVASITFVVISQIWLLYTPSGSDKVFSSVEILFKGVPRIIFSSLIVNAICQKIDVFLYHAIWKMTTKITKSEHKGLWVRNNVATLTTQLINAILFNTCAFAGTVDFIVLVQIIASSYIIFIFTSLLDTPIVYAVRKIHESLEKRIGQKNNFVIDFFISNIFHVKCDKQKQDIEQLDNENEKI